MGSDSISVILFDERSRLFDRGNVHLKFKILLSRSCCYSTKARKKYSIGIFLIVIANIVHNRSNKIFTK